LTLMGYLLSTERNEKRLGSGGGHTFTPWVAKL